MHKAGCEQRSPFASQMTHSPLRSVSRGPVSQHEASGGVGELLDDFSVSSLFDTECRLIVAVVIIAISATYGLGSAIVVHAAFAHDTPHEHVRTPLDLLPWMLLMRRF